LPASHLSFKQLIGLCFALILPHRLFWLARLAAK